MSSNSLEGTVVLVTGGAGGLGKVIAKAYLDAGASVAICDIHAERLAEAEQELQGERFLARAADITDEAAVGELADAVVRRFGRLDVLVNNAGMADSFDPAGSLTKDRWDRVLALNLTGSFLTTRAAVNQMEAQTNPPAGGLVLQIGSIAGLHGMSAGLAYTVSKHGVVGLVKNTAGFYGPKGIYAIGLMVGAMMGTNIGDSFTTLGGHNTEAFKQTTSVSMTAADVVSPEDVAKYCLFLTDRNIAASANGSCITFTKNFPKA
ncbi:hypothetical protein F5X96DRAFT_671517 [Biscogniauxia mediterranea]|nr:hypothetical protein F5X96DRAFT_671517 [Biscogniauxia mediterranea]